VGAMTQLVTHCWWMGVHLGMEMKMQDKGKL